MYLSQDLRGGEGSEFPRSPPIMLLTVLTNLKQSTDELTLCFQTRMASKDALSVVENASTAALAPEQM
jgi:hypothetical protein